MTWPKQTLSLVCLCGLVLASGALADAYVKQSQERTEHLRPARPSLAGIARTADGVLYVSQFSTSWRLSTIFVTGPHASIPTASHRPASFT
jgi:hypothetical protein